jgi:hypothetical protein
LNPASAWNQKKMAEKVSFGNWPVKVEQLVEQLNTDPNFKGSYPASACHQKKMAEKVSFCNWPVMVA